MTSITAQKTKLDLKLVPKENRLDIGKCNGRIPRGLKPKEETFQVVLDALALTLCYPAFLITADVPEVYMHQFWNCIYKHDDFYRFKIDKKKRFKLTLEVFRDIFQIFPRVPGHDFDALPSEEDTISFLRDLGHTGVINLLNDVVIDQMRQPWRTFAVIINRSLYFLFWQTSGLDKTCEVPPKVARKFKKASPSKKESELVPVDEETIKKGKRLKTPKVASNQQRYHHQRGSMETSKSNRKEKESVEKITPTITSERTGDKPGVPDVNNDDSSENARLEEPTETATRIVQGKGNDAEMTEAQQGNENLETTEEQVFEDAHVTISTVSKKTKVPVTSSSRSSDLASKFIIFFSIPQTNAEMKCLIDCSCPHEVPRTQHPLSYNTSFSYPESFTDYTNIPQYHYTSLLQPIQGFTHASVKQ
ncbi:hypothetical protein Tco_0421188 [Tanacetum coccineum]